MSVRIDDFKSAISSGIARTNLYSVELPNFSGAGIFPNTTELNLLCKGVSLPGRQIVTNERNIGTVNEKMAYGYAVDDLSLTFHVTNTYGLKRYFDYWQNLVFDQDAHELNFKKGVLGYSKQVVINQLSKKASGIVLANSPFNDIQQSLYPFSGGTEIIYSCVLDEAFPTTVNAIELSNDADGLVELNVQLSYTNWRSREL